MVERAGHLGPLCYRATGLLAEDALAAGRVERVEVQGGVLLGRRDARVADQVSHPGGSVAEPSDDAPCATLIVDTGSERHAGAERGARGDRLRIARI